MASWQLTQPLFLSILRSRNPLHTRAVLLQSRIAQVRLLRNISDVTPMIHACRPALAPMPMQQPCVFLQPDNKCSIHTVRPGQCSTYPWWPELMDQPRWDWEKGVTQWEGEGWCHTLDVWWDGRREHV